MITCPSIKLIVIMTIMHQTNLAGIDLNLLVVLDALLTEAHVGRAGQRVGLSQPAASHALGRLRSLLGDQLLVRSGTRMMPTPRAEALRAPLREALDGVRSVLNQESFAPATSRRHFRLMLPDPTAHLLLPPLLERLQREAPGMILAGLAWRGPDLLDEIALSRIDMIITSVEREWPGFDRESLYSDRDVAAVRVDHPLRAELATIEGLCAARHVAVVGAGERADILDQWLATTPIVRHVAAIAPSYVAALRIAAATDLVAVVPERLAHGLTASFGIELVPLPVDPGIDAMDLLCQKRLRADPAAIWLRQLLVDIASSLAPR